MSVTHKRHTTPTRTSISTDNAAIDLLQYTPALGEQPHDGALLSPPQKTLSAGETVDPIRAISERSPNTRTHKRTKRFHSRTEVRPSKHRKHDSVSIRHMMRKKERSTALRVETNKGFDIVLSLSLSLSLSRRALCLEGCGPATTTQKDESASSRSPTRHYNRPSPRRRGGGYAANRVHRLGDLYGRRRVRHRDIEVYIRRRATVNRSLLLLLLLPPPPPLPSPVLLLLQFLNVGRGLADFRFQPRIPTDLPATNKSESK